jgi:hypothetical protein
MKRWRILVWMPQQQNISVKRHINKDCRLCVVRQAHDMACKIAVNLNVKIGELCWQVERPTGHLDKWEIVWTDKTGLSPAVKRHAHR